MKQKILEKIEYHQGLSHKYKTEYDSIGLLGNSIEKDLKWIAHRSNELIVQALKELLEDE